MPKIDPSLINIDKYPCLPYPVENFVYEYGKEVFKVEDNELFCVLCDCKVRSQPKICVILHMTSEEHTQATKRHRQKKIEESDRNRERQQEIRTFHKELCEAFIAAEIPLSKLSHPTLRTFLEKYTKNPIPNQTKLKRLYEKSGGDMSRCDYFFDSN